MARGLYIVCRNRVTTRYGLDKLSKGWYNRLFLRSTHLVLLSYILIRGHADSGASRPKYGVEMVRKTYDTEEVDEVEDIYMPPQEPCFGNKCIAVKPCAEKCRLRARACERMENSPTLTPNIGL